MKRAECQPWSAPFLSNIVHCKVSVNQPWNDIGSFGEADQSLGSIAAFPEAGGNLMDILKA
jgi:hypothetical protein